MTSETIPTDDRGLRIGELVEISRQFGLTEEILSPIAPIAELASQTLAQSMREAIASAGLLKPHYGAVQTVKQILMSPALEAVKASLDVMPSPGLMMSEQLRDALGAIPSPVQMAVEHMKAVGHFPLPFLTFPIPDIWRQPPAHVLAFRAATDAVHRGDLEAVRWFLHEWLGYRQPRPEQMEAAVELLLDPQTEEKLPWEWNSWNTTFRGLIVKAPGRSRPPWERKIGGLYVGSLDEKVQTGIESTAYRIDLVPGTWNTEELALQHLDARFENPQLFALWQHLTPKARAVFAAHAANIENKHRWTWGQSAQQVGLTAQEGELVRRQVKRLALIILKQGTT